MAVTAAIGSSAIFLPFAASSVEIVAIAVGYGAVLSFLVIGLMLAARFRFARLWLASSAVIIACHAGLLGYFAAFPAVVLTHLNLLLGFRWSLLLWLTSSAVLAGAGWFIYFTVSRPAAIPPKPNERK